jgi:hypothetical protein
VQAEVVNVEQGERNILKELLKSNKEVCSSTKSSKNKIVHKSLCEFQPRKEIRSPNERENV